MRREYYWLVCKDENGQRYLIFGSDKTADEARQVGFSMGMNDFEIRKFPTRDMASASHMLKYGIAKEGQDVSLAGKRLRHHAPSKYHRRRTSE